MSSTGYNNLNIPSLNGLQTIKADQVTTTTLTSENIALGNLEVTNIIIDTDLTFQTGSNIIANGATVSDVELSYLDGASSNVQSQINAITTDIDTLDTQCLNIVGTDSVTTTINNDLVLTENLEAPGVLFDSSVTPQTDPFRPADKSKLDDTTLINSSNKLNAALISTGVVTNTEFDYLDGVTSNIQTQINTTVNYDSRITDLESDVDTIDLNIQHISGSSTATRFLTGNTEIKDLFISSNSFLLDTGVGIQFSTSGTQVDPFLPADKTQLAKLDNVTSTEVGYLDGLAENVQEALDYLTPAFSQYTTTDLLNDDLTDTANYVNSNNEWSPMGATKLDTGVYIISLMATLDNINQLNKLRCKIRVKDGTGILLESHYAGTILDNSTNNKQWYYLNTTLHYESTDTDNYVTVFSDYYFKPNSSCLCSARLQITRV